MYEGVYDKPVQVGQALLARQAVRYRPGQAVRRREGSGLLLGVGCSCSALAALARVCLGQPRLMPSCPYTHRYSLNLNRH